MSTRLTYHGAASFEIVGPTHRVLIDPFLSDTESRRGQSAAAAP